MRVLAVAVRERERGSVIFIFAGNHMAGRSICELRKGKCSWGSSGALSCCVQSSLFRTLIRFKYWLGEAPD